MLSTWNDILGGSFRSIGNGIIAIIPNLLIAILLFILGCIVGSLVGSLVAHLIRAIKIDTLLQKANVEEYFNRAGLKLDTGHFIGALVKWFIIIVFLMASLEALGLREMTVFLQDVVLMYVPRVIVAVLILVAAAIIGDALSKIVSSSARVAEMTSANLLGTITKWAIWIFAALAALFQLGIAGPLIGTLFTGVVAALALAGGLAFGLGGQGAASEFIEKIRADIAHKDRK